MFPRVTVYNLSALFSIMDRVGSSESSISVFVGLNGSSADLGLTSGNIWAFTRLV